MRVVPAGEGLRAFFFFNDTATTEIYTLSLHDALPICVASGAGLRAEKTTDAIVLRVPVLADDVETAAPLAAGKHLLEERSEEHTSELQSRLQLVCPLLLEKKKKQQPHDDSPVPACTTM